MFYSKVFLNLTMHINDVRESQFILIDNTIICKTKLNVRSLIILQIGIHNFFIKFI